MKPVKRWLRLGRPAAVAAATLFFLMVLGLLFEEKLIYFPESRWSVTPRELGLAFEELRLAADDGVVLHGWFLPVTGSRSTILFCHGNAGNVSHRLDRVLMIQKELGADVLLFDYRGYGASEGSPSEEGTYRDGRAAYRHLVEDRGVPAERIVLFGESLGTAIALQLATEVKARAAILEAPFTSIPDMARAVYPFLPVSAIEGWIDTRYDNLAKISRLEMPVLILHGTEDRVVPFEQGRRLYEAAPARKRFYPITGAGHNDTYLVGSRAYWDAWRAFLDQAGAP